MFRLALGQDAQVKLWLCLAHSIHKVCLDYRRFAGPVNLLKVQLFTLERKYYIMDGMENTKRINAIGAWLKEEFGQKIIKLSIDGGFTCPNRDGRVGVGGCIFCSSEGSGELASDIPGQMKLLSEKWPNATAYLAYFQSHTSTYAPVEVLRKQYEEALAAPGVVGIAIATRPDCLPPEVLDLLSELNEKTFLWVELGLQTIHEDSASMIKRFQILPQEGSRWLPTLF
ncbi:MAG: hypothetical protein RR472_03310 [Anaerovoracaceae bacterium]